MQYSFKACQEHNNWVVRDFLRSKGISTASIRAVKLLSDGITINGVKANTNQRVLSGDIVCVKSALDKETSVAPQNIDIEIIYESQNAMLINKPAGMAVHPTYNCVDGTLANAFCGLMHRRGTPMPMRAINRIDRNTSGLVLLALNSFSVPFFAKSIQKEYYAIVQGQLNPPSAEIDAPIARCPNSIITREVMEGGQRAVTQYCTLAQNDEISLVLAKLITGRTHQVRVHFSHSGCPLCGDDLYGGNKDKISRHALHCGRISFREPFAECDTNCVAPFPQDMADMLKLERIFWQMSIYNE